MYGVLLSGWGYENFFSIGNIFGRVLSVDHSNFDRAKILIITDCLFNINCEMEIDIEGTLSKIFISENQTQYSITQPEIQSQYPPSSPNSDQNGLTRSAFADSVNDDVSINCVADNNGTGPPPHIGIPQKFSLQEIPFPQDHESAKTHHTINELTVTPVTQSNSPIGNSPSHHKDLPDSLLLNTLNQPNSEPTHHPNNDNQPKRPNPLQ